MIFSIYCIECDKSVAYSKIPLTKPEIIFKCPRCDFKQRGDFRQMPMCELYQTALAQYDASQYAFSVILSYTNIELLFEHFLIHMFMPKINDRGVLKFFLEKNSNIKFRRDQIFKFLVGESYFQKVKNYIISEPKANYLEKFDEISEFRNEILHRGRWGDDLVAVRSQRSDTPFVSQVRNRPLRAGRLLKSGVLLKA